MPVRWGRDDDTLSKMWQSRQGAGGSYHQLDSFTPGFSRLRDGSRAKADLQDTTAEDLWSGTDPRHLRASPLQDTPPRVPVRRQSPAKAQAASLLRRTFQPLNRGSPGPLKAQPVKCSIPSPPLPSKSPESTAQATSIASSPAPELCLRLPVPEHLQAVNSRPADPVPFKGFQQQPPVSPPTRLQAQPAGTAGRPADALPTAAHQPAAPGSPAATAHSQSGSLQQRSEEATPPWKPPGPARPKVHVPKLALPPAIGSPVALPLAQPSLSADSGSEISITSLQVSSVSHIPASGLRAEADPAEASSAPVAHRQPGRPPSHHPRPPQGAAEAGRACAVPAVAGLGSDPGVLPGPSRVGAAAKDSQDAHRKAAARGSGDLRLLWSSCERAAALWMRRSAADRLQDPTPGRPAHATKWGQDDAASFCRTAFMRGMAENISTHFTSPASGLVVPPVAGHPRAKLHKDVQSALQEAAAISPHAPAAGPGSTMPDRGHPLPGQASPPQPKASKQSPSPVKPRRPAKHTQSPPPSARTLEDADRPVATSPAQAEAQALLPAQGNLPAGLAAPQPAESSELALSVCTAASTPPTGLLNSLLTNNPGLVSDRQRLEWQLRSAQTEMQSMWDHCQSLGLGLRREAGVRRGLEGALASAHMEATDLDRQLRESQAEQGRLVAALAALHSRAATPGAAGEGPGTPSWLLESADGARAAPAGKDQGPEREDRPGQGEIGEDGLEHYDVTPDPTKRRLSLTPQSTRHDEDRASCSYQADSSAVLAGSPVLCPAPGYSADFSDSCPQDPEARLRAALKRAEQAEQRVGQLEAFVIQMEHPSSAQQRLKSARSIPVSQASTPGSQQRWNEAAAVHCSHSGPSCDLSNSFRAAENEAALEQEVARQLQRVGSLQAQLLQVHAAADACQGAAAMREAELMAQIEEREASLQAAQEAEAGSQALVAAQECELARLEREAAQQRAFMQARITETQALLHAALREAAAASTRAEELANAGAAAIIASSPCTSSATGQS